MKKQNGLTIIKLMFLLLAAGIAGSMIIDALIKHRCLSETDAPMCSKKFSMNAPPNHDFLVMH